jgi:hypothetical protein
MTILLVHLDLFAFFQSQFIATLGFIVHEDETRVGRRHDG